ncbi:hypothetical protein KUL70_002489 [Vibrio parahaemolyticus]|nr:hypothetical protein [Vibrio parahaemolyticus]
MYLVSADPGLSGAITVFESDIPVECINIYKTKDINQKNVIDFHRVVLFLSRFSGSDFVCEQIWAMKHDTPKTAFSLGRAYESLLQAAKQAGLTVHTVAPLKWKKDSDFTSKSKDEVSLVMHSLYPVLLPKTPKGNINHNKADSIAIGLWWIDHGKSQHELELIKEAKRAERAKKLKVAKRARAKSEKAKNTVPKTNKKTKEQ